MRMFIQKEIAGRTDEFATLCKKHKVASLYAFGSSVHDDFDSDRSDIDLLVEIDGSDPVDRGENLLSLWDTFETFFNRKIDLLTDVSITNPYLRKNINETKVLIYDRSGPKVLI